ncbi:glycosyltransferase family 2 protein [Candidatus Nitrospira salsa]
MGQSFRLSVIIPCLNAEATLGQQLNALASQQWSEPWELIIADNGSLDSSMEIVRTFEEKFSGIRVVNVGGAHRSAAHARNVGARAARSDTLAFCDADDEVASTWVGSMIHALSNHLVVCGQFQFDKFNDSRTANDFAKSWEDGLYIGRFLPGGGSGNFGIKKWLHERIGGFDECLLHAEDADYFWRIQLEGFALHYEPTAAIQIRIGRVNPSLRSLYFRSKNRFASNYWCYKRYRVHGMLAPPSLRGSIVQLFRTIKGGVRVHWSTHLSRDSWLRRFAQQAGELVGQVQGRLTNPCKPYWPGQNIKV